MIYPMIKVIENTYYRKSLCMVGLAYRDPLFIYFLIKTDTAVQNL